MHTYPIFYIDLILKKLFVKIQGSLAISDVSLGELSAEINLY